MRRRAFLGALGALLSVALVGVWPAAAASSPTLTLGSPADGVTWTGNVPTDFHVSGHADAVQGGNVDGVFANFDPADKGTHHYTGNQQWTSDTAQTRNFDFLVFPDFNGKYRVTVYARGRVACGILGCPNDQDGPSVARTITVTVAPKAPTGTKSSIDANGKATITWNANNTEGDLIGYAIERADPGGNYTCLTGLTIDPAANKPTTYSLTDDLKGKPSGDYRWRVRAVRAIDSDTKMGTCAAPAGIPGPASVSTGQTWSDPTATTTSTTLPGGSTTTTVKKGGSGGGGGGTGGGTGGGGTGGGGGTSGGGNSSFRSGNSTAPNLAALGSLGGANNLARTPSLAGGAGEADSGFNELLPFSPGSDGAGATGGSADLPQTPLNGADSGNGSTTTLLFIAAGLLVTVLSMHVLWLKAQVDRAPLEPLAPQDIAVL